MRSLKSSNDFSDLSGFNEFDGFTGHQAWLLFWILVRSTVS
jgi:hypothetical protein